MSSERLVTYYVTKYCLTRGIFEVELTESDTGGLVSGYEFNEDGYSYYVAYWVGKECFTSKKAAVFNANMRRDKAMADAKKKISKLESLIFEV